MSNDRGIRWGIMGTGNMAGRMVSCIRAMDGEVIAVASRANKSARAFASQHGIEMAFAGYEALAAEADVDVVYIATTNDQHYRNALSCIGHGKAVLCEKPLTVHLRETVALIDAARENDTLLVEAMWMRFQPFVPVLEDLIREQRIGPVRFLNAHFAFPASDDANGRWFNRELGGGSLLDIGVYPLTLANLVLGAANVSHAVATLAPTGVDAQCSISSVHAGGAMSMLGCSFTAAGLAEATVAGPLGRIRLPSPFHHCPELVLDRHGSTAFEVFDTSYPGDGLECEIAEVHRCLLQGQAESPLMPLADSLAIAEWRTHILEQIGVIYPDT